MEDNSTGESSSQVPVQSYIVTSFTGIIVSLIPLLVAEQDSTIASVMTTILILFWFVCIFFSGIPAIRDHLSTFMDAPAVIVVLLINMMIPYIMLVFFGLSLSQSILPFFLWYILPSVLLMILNSKNEINSSIRLVLSVSSALLYWIGFDHRYTIPLFEVFNDISYIMNGFWIASLMMTGYGFQFGINYKIEEDDYQLQPTRVGIKYGQLGSIGASAIIVPVGLLTGFLSFNPMWPGLEDVIIGFIGIYLTISLQEELVFRGMILNEVDRYSLPKGVDTRITLVLTSFMFGLTHWNNEVPEYVIHYIILATVAGIGYGWAYRKSGMFGAMLAHTLVDWVWSLVLLRA